MIRRIAQKEFTEIRRDGRFRWTAAILFALLLVSLVVGWQKYSTVRAEREAAQTLERERWTGQSAKHPHSAAHYGIYAFKPQMPLSAIEQGINAYAGTSVFLEAHNQNLALNRPAENATLLERFGETTAAVALQLLVPLLIVLLLYNSFAGERETGTLRQILSLGAARRDLAFGKALGAGFALALVLLPAAILGSAAMFLYTETALSFETLPRLALMTLGYLIYFAVFVWLALGVSARARSSRAALLVLLAFWFFGGFLLPTLATDIAKAVYPTPNGLDFHARLEEADRQKKGILGWQIEVQERLLKEYGADSVEKLPINPSGVALVEDENEGNRLREVHYNDLYLRHERQNRIYKFGAILSPFPAMQSLSAGLAGTDYAHHRHFADAAENYRREFVQMLNRNDVEHGDLWIPGTMMQYRASPELWAQIPPFSYEPPPLVWTLKNHATGIALLLVWLAASVFFAFRALARMRID